MNRLVTLLLITVGICAGGPAFAGKVNMPKEGSYEFDFCPIGRGKTFSDGNKFFVMSYDLDAIVKSTPAGTTFDRMGARCFGIYVNVNDTPRESGMCELTDLDGDKWWMDYHGTWDGGGGTYVAAHGTGKYSGITLQGEYHIDNTWGSISKEVSFQGCNHNKGTYKLK